MARRDARLLVAVASLLALGSCEAKRMRTLVGRNAIIHWNPEEHTLCGGTLEYVDASLEVIADTYGVSLPTRPAIEIYWELDGSLASGLCSSLAAGCTAPFPNGTNFMVLYNITHAHELAHAVRLTGESHGMPAFFGEGVAVRWERDPSVPMWWRPAAFEHEEPPADVRALLDQPGLDGQAYGYAGFFWTWLEAEHGGPAMARFASNLRRFSPAADIERELLLNFGVSFDEAIEAFEQQPPLMFDIHACAMDLPRLTWEDQPLVLSDGPSSCDFADVINVSTPFLDSWDGAIRLSRLQLPDSTRPYVATLSGPADGRVFLEPCLDRARPYQDGIILSPADGQVTVMLAGDYVVTALAPIEDDGEVRFVEARLEAP